jgi:TRAP-type C4-dicarboxylate transport system permease small subunit
MSSPGGIGAGRFEHLAGLVRRIEWAIVLGSLVLVVGSVLWGVLTRYVSPRPAAWTGEIASIAFCWLGFLGATLIFRGDHHPRIFDPGSVGVPALRSTMLVLGGVVQIAVLVAVGILALKQIGINMANPTAVLRLPGAIYYLPIAWFSAASLLRLTLRG